MPMSASKTSPARVWLIGAGPGDVELMTLKAVRALSEADVVLVDDLVNPDVLKFARADAQVQYVGKRGGHPSTPQAVIIEANARRMCVPAAWLRGLKAAIRSCSDAVAKRSRRCMRPVSRWKWPAA